MTATEEPKAAKTTESKPAQASPPVVPTPTDNQQESMTVPDADAELASMFRPRNGAPTVPPPEPPKATPPPEKPAVTPVPSAPADKPAEDAKATDPKGGPAALREAYEKTKRRMIELESKLADYDEVSSKYKAISDQYEKDKTRLGQLEEAIKFTDYTRSTEYQDKYVQPITRASQEFADEFLGWETTDGKKVSADDLLGLIKLPTNHALTRAKEMFGEMTTEVMAHRRKIVDLTKQRDAAIEHYRKTAEEREKEQRVQSELHRNSLKKAYITQLDQLSKSDPSLYGSVEGDDEGNEMLENGWAFVDATLDTTSDLTPETRAKNFAVIRSKAGAFDRLAAALQRERKEKADLAAELEKYRKSDPGSASTTSANDSSKPRVKSADEELAEIFRR